MTDEIKLSDLVGKVFISVKNNGDEIQFMGMTDSYHLYHCQECCEQVYVEDVIGDLKDLENCPILSAEEVSETHESRWNQDSYQDSCTWTFYKISTQAGSVTIRFYGTSNGYYSEEVSFGRISN